MAQNLWPFCRSRTDCMASSELKLPQKYSPKILLCVQYQNLVEDTKVLNKIKLTVTAQGRELRLFGFLRNKPQNIVICFEYTYTVLAAQVTKMTKNIDHMKSSRAAESHKTTLMTTFKTDFDLH